MSMTAKFMPLSPQDLDVRYGSFRNPARKTLDASKVPESLRPLIPYAELWGVTDDLQRENLVLAAPALAKEDLMKVVDAFNAELDVWLAGPESDSLPFTAEYLAFSAMRMARDFL